jgi:hypothetical protein
VIVRQDSQIAGAAAGQYATINLLAHSAVSYSSTFNAILQFTSFRDYSVLNSYAVDTVTECWLKSIGSSTCPAMIGAAIPAPVMQAGLDHAAGAPPINTLWIPRFRDDSRAAVEVPRGKLFLAVPNEISVRTHSGQLKDVIVTQSNADGEFSQGGNIAAAKALESDVFSVEVTPLRLGAINLELLTRFADGGFALQNVKVMVEPPDTRPEMFKGDKYAIHVLTLDRNRSAILQPSAKYARIASTLPIDPSFVEYRVVDADPVVRLHDGVIEALREGESTIEARYGGVVSSFRVVVKEHVYR